MKVSVMMSCPFSDSVLHVQSLSSELSNSLKSQSLEVTDSLKSLLALRMALLFVRHCFWPCE